MNTPPTPEDRLWTILAHLSALALGVGIVLPVVGWSDQRRKSKYAAFQSLQALGYQSLGYTIWILFSAIAAILFIITILANLNTIEGNGGNTDTFVSLWASLLTGLTFGLVGMYCLLPILAAVACALGKDFRYPILGDRLARYVGYDPTEKSEAQLWLDEDHEFRWVAAMGHFSILVLFWGMLAPLTTWILYGKRSFFLKFQSIQTLLYQAIATLMFFGGALISSLGLVLFPIAVLANSSDLSSSTGIVAVVIFIALMLISVVILLIVPLFHILGQWAGYRVLKGEDYRYPLIGKFIEKRL